ncbi:protein crumbs homolog 1-like isoform X2 [Pseudoliparis swirei]|uniref:protein crumbs homolog 1-like isoform X2 n=1 Tax=Pseudoliparis swirei TaxID=2059687 RepID=UPI0024BD8832|nr:protein crumbs homolog 1-like isoform X2 [Pseudoliparis swirei]
MLRFSVQVWMLWLLYAGTLSDEDISACKQQPCQNGGLCESHNGGFRCLCSQQRQKGRLDGGENCTTALSGCDDNQCENGGICSALYPDQHTCICLAGFTGPRCQSPTLFSLESRGFMYIETRLLDPEVPLNVTFSFRNARPVGTLLQRRVGDLLLSLELMDGRLSLRSLRGQGSSTLVQELPELLSNNKWHTAEASLGGGVSFIRLLCTEGSCIRDSSAEVQLLEQASALPEPGTVRQSLFIGAIGGNWGSGRGAEDADYPPSFLGCFRDVFVDSHLVLPAILPDDSNVQENITVGCSDKDKCDDSPCQNRGRCVSRGWRNYMCECHRPYEGNNCADEYITARFGEKDLESFAVFSLDDDPNDTVTISMFIRTRQSSGLLLILANSTSQYLCLWLEEGGVKVQVNNFETLAGQGAVSDGHFHLVTLKLEGMVAMLFQSAHKRGSMPIRPIQTHPGDLVFVGGLPDSRDTASFGGYFKGCVQDLRITSKRLHFYPIATPVGSYSLEQLVNVSQGCSSDDACAVNPCLNGGVCYSMWDDFICNCPPNTAGQSCEEVKWCERSPCPDTAVCQHRSQGFECLSNVTFRVESSILRYRSNGKIQSSLSSVSLSFRTRQSRQATLMHAQRGSHYLTVSLLNAHVVMALQSGAGKDFRKATVQSKGPISDGEWHTVELSMENQTLPSSRWILAVDGGREEQGMSKTAAGNLDFLREGADIFLGGLSLDTGVNLTGCLGPVEIGGLPLPFYLNTDLNLPRPQEEQFAMIKADDEPRYGCWGVSVCAPNPCNNDGVCEDMFDLHHCTCPSEWTGTICQDLTDTCISGPCIYGNCIQLHEGFKCVCEPGYGGIQYEAEVDMCENSKCRQGASCLKGFNSYACLCPQNLTGEYCEENIPEIPWYIETNPCEKDVDECASDPCLNGGFCLNYVNRFKCVCDMDHSGIHCQLDVSDFYLYLVLGLWQNLFQLVSYLVLRLDDEPEVEWVVFIND